MDDSRRVRDMWRVRGDIKRDKRKQPREEEEEALEWKSMETTDNARIRGIYIHSPASRLASQACRSE